MDSDTQRLRRREEDEQHLRAVGEAARAQWAPKDEPPVVAEPEPVPKPATINDWLTIMVPYYGATGIGYTLSTTASNHLGQWQHANVMHRLIEKDV